MNPDRTKKNDTPMDAWTTQGAHSAPPRAFRMPHACATNTTAAAGNRSGVRAGSRSRRADMEPLGGSGAPAPRPAFTRGAQGYLTYLIGTTAPGS